jgi:poly(3-hydroxybutyrate) depolymerase
MAKGGEAYVPERCTTGTTCAVHIVFHGCGQADMDTMSTVVRKSGYAEWAEANDFVVLFPRAAGSTANPNACWDWWGYTGPGYLTKAGPQIRAVRAMLDHMAE